MLVTSVKIGGIEKYGVVEKILTPKTLLVRMRGGDKIWTAMGQTVLLVPNCLIQK